MSNQKSTIPLLSSNIPHNLPALTIEQLRIIMKQLESQHDIMEARNEQLAIHIADMRTVIKQVEKQKTSELEYVLQKKKKLQDEIERCEAALRIANSNKNTMHSDMVAFKGLYETEK